MFFYKVSIVCGIVFFLLDFSGPQDVSAVPLSAAGGRATDGAVRMGRLIVRSKRAAIPAINRVNSAGRGSYGQTGMTGSRMSNGMMNGGMAGRRGNTMYGQGSGMGQRGVMNRGGLANRMMSRQSRLGTQSSDDY